MYYFIPAWYGNHNFWHSDIIPWYYSQQRLEFDDVLHQMRIFHGGEVPSQFIFLSYHPHARYFFHRQDVYEMDYYSVFDDIQDIRTQEIHPFHVKDLDWEEGCDFIYTPFAMVVERYGKLFAHIEFGLEGFISKITYFEEEKLHLECLFDDRGFTSSVVTFEDGQAFERFYLNPDGVWQFCESLQEAKWKIRVNPEVVERFQQLYYHSLDELVWEFFENFLASQYQKGDRFIIASDLRINQTLFEHLPENSDKILSFFKERNGGDDLAQYGSFLRESKLVISDRQDFLQQLVENYPDLQKKMHHLPSFDTRLKLGISQRVKESKIYFQVDLDEGFQREVACEVLKFVAKNPLTELVFGLFNAQGNQLQELEEQIQDIVENQLSREDFQIEVFREGAENAVEENYDVSSRLRIVNMVDELSLMQELEYTRLIVDLNNQPNLYTQIAGISTGIPQINETSSEYVEHLKNGYILENITEFSKAAHHFLDTLKYWNQSLIYSIEKIRANTGEQFIEKWQNWLEEEAHAEN